MVAFLVALSLYTVFFLYLMLVGAGVARTLGVLGVAAYQSALTGLVIGIVVALFSVSAGVQTFFGVMTFMSLILLPTAALSRARDFILPGSSALEVVCLNVLVLAIGRPPDSLPLFNLFFQGGYHLLLNPFVLLMPPWLGFALSFWPSALALRLAAQGADASLRLRFFLNLWVQVMSIIWVLPAAIGTFKSFRAGSLTDHAEALFACLSLVYVVLTWMTLRDAIRGKRTTMPGERSEDSTERTGVARALADRMDPGRRSPLACALAGLLTYLLAFAALLTFLDPQLAATLGFIAIVALGALTKGAAQDDEAPPAAPSWQWGGGALLMVGMLLCVRPLALALIAQRQHTVFSPDHAEQRLPARVSPVDAGAQRCAIDFQAVYRLRCANEIWNLQAASHPAKVEEPLGLDVAGARDFALAFGARTINCAEIPAQVRRRDGPLADTTLLLVYVPGAQSSRQYSWLVDRAASCSRVVELQRSRLVGLSPGFGYRWQPETAASRKELVGWLGVLFDSVK